MKAACSLNRIAKYVFHGIKNFISLLWIPIFHYESDVIPQPLWNQVGNSMLKNPTETKPLLVWNPHPHKNHLPVNGRKYVMRRLEGGIPCC